MSRSTVRPLNRAACVVVAVVGVALVSPMASGECPSPSETCFQGIGDLAGGDIHSRAEGVARAADGRVVVVGSSSSTDSAATCSICREAVTFSSGILNRLLTHPGGVDSLATDVAIVGNTTFTVGGAQDSNGRTRAFRVQQQALSVSVQPTFLPQLSGTTTGLAHGISDDATVVVGRQAPPVRAFRWTSTTGTTPIPILDPTVFKANNQAFGVSPSGGFTVGRSSASSGPEGFIVPVPRSIGQDPGGLGDLTGGVFDSVANAVSDGGVAVGRSSSSSGDEAFRWIPPVPPLFPARLVGLGDLPGGLFSSEALDVSGNGAIVVGVGRVSDTVISPERAFVWHSSFGMRDLREVLIEDGATGLSGWTLTEATAIATDGLAIAGNARNPDDDPEGWVVTLRDCNDNGIWDAVDLQFDCNNDRIPDDCQADCNGNTIPDDCDIASGFSADCDGNGIPEECEATETLDELFNQDQASAELFREGRDDPQNPVTFGTMIQRYGRPWSPDTQQTPGGVGTCIGGERTGEECLTKCACPGGTCQASPGGPADPDPAERLRTLAGVRAHLPFDLALRILDELHAFEMLLGNEAFADAMDPTVGEGASGEEIAIEQIPDLFAFRGVPAVPSLVEEELALLRGRQIDLPASLDEPFSDDPATDPDGNYPQFGAGPRTCIYNRLRPNAQDALGSLGYRSNYGFANTTDNEAASQVFPQGHGDAYGYYLKAIKVTLGAFGAGGAEGPAAAFALAMIRAQGLPEASGDCTTADCEEVTDDDGVVHDVGARRVRNMATAMAARARTAIRIVDLTFRRDYREHAETALADSDAQRAWGMADWARRGGTGAYLDWAILNQLLAVPADGAAGGGVEAVDRTTVEQVGALASAVDQMQERVGAAGAGLDPLGLMPNVVPFRIIQPGQLLDFLEGGKSAGQSHYGIVRDAALEAIRNARGILTRANSVEHRLRENESAFDEFENQVVDSDTALTDRLIEIFGLPSPSDTSDNDFEDNDGDGVQLVLGVNDPDDDFLEAGCDGGCPGTPDLRNFLIDDEALEAGLGWERRLAVGEIQLAMFGLRAALLKVNITEQELAQLEALIDNKARNLALTRNEAVEELEIKAEACEDQLRVIDRTEDLAKIRQSRGFLSRAAGIFTSALVCGASGTTCGDSLKGHLSLINEGLGNVLSGSDPESELETEFDLQREELRINCWQTAELTRISNEQQIRAMEIELENLMRETPQAILSLTLARSEARQALGVLNRNVQQGKRLIDDRARVRRVKTDRLNDFRWRDLAFRAFRNQALEQYGAFFDLAARYVMLAARAFAYEYNERDEVDLQVRNLYRERLLGSGLAADRGLESIIARLDNKRQTSDFNSRLQKLSLFDHSGDAFSIRKNLLGLAINPATDDFEQQRRKNKAFRAFLESHVVQDLLDVPAFRQFGSIDSARDAGPAIVLTFATEVAGHNFFGQRRGVTFGSPANFDSCSNPKIFEYAVLLEGVDNPGALGVDSQLIFGHFLPVGTSMLREPLPNDCADRLVRSWAVVDQRVPGVSEAYRTPGTEILEGFDRPRLATAPDLNVINRFPVTSVQVRLTENPVFQDDLAGWSAWNTQWMLAIPGRQFTDPTEDAAVVRQKLLILIYDANQQGEPRNPDENLGIDDIKLRIKAYGKPS